MELEDSLRTGDEHLDTILETESNEFIKSSVENLVPSLSESKDLSDCECDVPACEDFITFSNLLFDADDDFSSSDDESFFYEDIPKEIYSNPLFDKEIIFIKIDSHHLNAESDLKESLLNQDSSIISSSKINSLLDEYADELILLKSIPPRIDEADCDLRKKFVLSRNCYDSMPPGIEDDDYDSKGDILILEELLSNDSLSLPENESFHFDIPSSPRPPAKPPDDDEIEPNSRILTVKVLDDDRWREHSYLGCSISPFLPSLTNSSTGDQVKLSDLKQALRGRHPMLILVVVMNKMCCCEEARLFHFSCFAVLNVQEFLDFKDSCLGFYPLITGSSLPQIHLGNQISKSYRTNVYLLAYLINGLRFA
nr:hypothetical protein [Tanacetum cinerariifolium]